LNNSIGYGRGDMSDMTKIWIQVSVAAFVIVAAVFTASAVIVIYLFE
jgi:hypothetical protein